MKEKQKCTVRILLVGILASSLIFVYPAIAGKFTKDQATNLHLYRLVADATQLQYFMSFKEGNMVDSLYFNTMCSLAIEEMSKIYFEIPMPYSDKLKVHANMEKHGARVQDDQNIIKNKIHQKMLHLKSIMESKVKNTAQSPEVKELIIYSALMSINYNELSKSLENHNIARALFCSELCQQIFFEIEGLLCKKLTFSQVQEIKRDLRLYKKQSAQFQNFITVGINRQMKRMIERYKREVLQKSKTNKRY